MQRKEIEIERKKESDRQNFYNDQQSKEKKKRYWDREKKEKGIGVSQKWRLPSPKCLARAISTNHNPRSKSKGVSTVEAVMRRKFLIDLNSFSASILHFVPCCSSPLIRHDPSTPRGYTYAFQYVHAETFSILGFSLARMSMKMSEISQILPLAVA